MKRELRGRVALVTGGGTGIGRGIALALARRGVSLALVGRRPEPLERAARRARAHGARVEELPADLAEPGAAAGILDRVRLALGPADIVVCNAGVLAGGDLSSLSEEEVRRAVTVNLLAPAQLVRAALPDLVQRKGAVVLVASAMSFVPMPYASLYSATKAGIKAFGESLRYELEPQGVLVMVVVPPATDTAMVRGMAEAAGTTAFPLWRPGVVGERIARGLEAGKHDLHMGGADRAVAVLYAVAPRLVRAALRSQRARFARMMTAGRGNPAPREWKP
jgi:short-subunit dehydrogenase